MQQLTRSNTNIVSVLVLLSYVGYSRYNCSLAKFAIQYKRLTYNVYIYNILIFYRPILLVHFDILMLLKTYLLYRGYLS